MPGMNGVDLARQIQRKYHELPVLGIQTPDEKSRLSEAYGIWPRPRTTS